MGILMIRLLIVVLSFIIFTGAVRADTQTFECVYLKQASLNDGEVETNNTDFKLSFIVDKSEKQAYILGNNGSSKVLDIPNVGGITFVEVTGTGNVSTTTIADNLQSVHSRNTIMSLGKTELIPSQYYGKCILK